MTGGSTPNREFCRMTTRALQPPQKPRGHGALAGTLVQSTLATTNTGAIRLGSWSLSGARHTSATQSHASLAGAVLLHAFLPGSLQKRMTSSCQECPLGLGFTLGSRITKDAMEMGVGVS
eukprot:scaffold111111_cov20-Tisochrysis_lutea.AAC.2